MKQHSIPEVKTELTVMRLHVAIRQARGERSKVHVFQKRVLELEEKLALVVAQRATLLATRARRKQRRIT